MTLRQLRGFLGITGYCHIWIPGYGKLARPLRKLITETQQAQTDKLVWSPNTQKASKALQTALLLAPALSLPTGSEFNLFVIERKGVALGVLTQSRGPHQQPIAYLSRELDVISCGWASLVAQRLKRLPPMRETWVRSSSILAWRIPRTEELGRC